MELWAYYEMPLRKLAAGKRGIEEETGTRH